ncbi:MAG: hypothetical protein ABFQ62_01935 [Patescibacteria group bacterium]
MKKIIIFSTLVFLIFGFSACTGDKASKSSSSSTSSEAVEKSGETTKTGKIIQAGGTYFLESSDGQRQKLDSYSVDLSAYVNSTVTVIGQFSGDDLFVGSVK